MPVPTAPNMMDEIDLQLCLDLDLIIPGTPRPKLGRGKRSAPEAADDTSDNYEKYTLALASPCTSIIPGSFIQQNDDHNLTLRNDGRHDGDRERDRDPELYLALPPRKRVRTSLSVPALGRKGTLQLEDHADQAAASLSEVVVNECGDGNGGAVQNPKRASLPVGLEGLDGAENIQSLSIAAPASGPDTGMDIDMNTDNHADETKNDTDNTIPPHFPIHALMHHRPRAPFVYFPEGPYFPAISDTLPSREASGGRATKFAIYEDTEDFMMDMDMDVDEEGEGSWLVPTWYFSPEENKENTEEEHENEQRQQHEDGHFLLGSDGYDVPFAGMAPSSIHPSIEQRAYHNNTTVRPQGLADYEPAPRRQDPLEGSSNFYQHIGLGDRPNDGFTRADNQHPVPSPSFLSATEMSLQTLLGRASATESTPGLRSRRSRRTIRSLNIV